MILLTRLTGESYECSFGSLRTTGPNLPVTFRVECVSRGGGKSFVIEVGDFDNGVGAPGVVGGPAKELAFQILELMRSSGVRNKDGLFLFECRTCCGLAFGSVKSQMSCAKGHRAEM